MAMSFAFLYGFEGCIGCENEQGLYLVEVKKHIWVVNCDLKIKWRVLFDIINNIFLVDILFGQF
jgi:hypothetical protein